jgi:hypothetical protein
MRLSATALAVSAAIALSARAGRAETEVTLNGVRIDGVTDQRIENATVFIDENGNIHIEAKGYAVRQIGGAGQAGAGDGRTAPEKLERRYFLVAEQPARDGAGYDVSVFINQRWIRDIKAGEAQVVLEVTKHLRPGPNKVVLAATRSAAAARRGARAVELRVVVGEGAADGEQVTIETPLVEMVRNAAENESFTEEYHLVAR